MSAEETMDEVLEHVREVQEQLGANLRMYRAYHRLMQEELAERAGVSRRYYVQLEQGDGNPSMRILAALAYALNMAPEMLLRRNELPALNGEHDEGGTHGG